MKQENEKWQDTDPRQKDDRSEMVQTGTRNDEQKTERLDNDKEDRDEDLSFWEGNGSDGGAAGDGGAA